MDDTVGTTVLDIVVVVAKFSNPETLNAAWRKQTDCCFFSNGNDSRSHKRILSYMLNNGLARNTKNGPRRIKDHRPKRSSMSRFKSVNLEMIDGKRTKL